MKLSVFPSSCFAGRANVNYFKSFLFSLHWRHKRDILIVFPLCQWVGGDKNFVPPAVKKHNSLEVFLFLEVDKRDSDFGRVWSGGWGFLSVHTSAWALKTLVLGWVRELFPGPG